MTELDSFDQSDIMCALVLGLRIINNLREDNSDDLDSNVSDLDFGYLNMTLLTDSPTTSPSQSPTLTPTESQTPADSPSESESETMSLIPTQTPTPPLETYASVFKAKWMRDFLLRNPDGDVATRWLEFTRNSYTYESLLWRERVAYGVNG